MVNLEFNPFQVYSAFFVFCQDAAIFTLVPEDFQFQKDLSKCNCL